MRLRQRVEGMPGVQSSYRGGFRILEVDCDVATYQGVPWKTLGDFGKRKYENLLVIVSNMDIHSKAGAKVIYKP